jgi:hypothetical protein
MEFLIFGNLDPTRKKTRQQLIGPRTFALDRMLGIFYNIIQDPVNDSVGIMQQVGLFLLYIPSPSLHETDYPQKKSQGRDAGFVESSLENHVRGSTRRHQTTMLHAFRDHQDCGGVCEIQCV